MDIFPAKTLVKNGLYFPIARDCPEILRKTMDSSQDPCLGGKRPDNAGSSKGDCS